VTDRVHNLTAMSHILSFVTDYRIVLDAAIHIPRVDASESAVVTAPSRVCFRPAIFSSRMS
jgi:hypothetical protein